MRRLLLLILVMTSLTVSAQGQNTHRPTDVKMSSNAEHSTITNCHADCGTVTGSEYVGGFVGSAKGKVSDCSTIADVSATGNNVGGFLGGSYGSDVSNASATGNVNASGDNVGGFCGSNNQYPATFHTCSTNGNVVGKDYVAGFIGKDRATNSELSSISHYGLINGNSHVAGVMGYGINAFIDNGGHNGDISASGNFVGGVVSFAESGASITRCYSVGNISAETSNYVGGIVGSLCESSTVAHHTISNNYSNGIINAHNYVGGVVGEIAAGATVHVTKNASYGSIYANQYVGGVIGSFTSESGESELKSNVSINDEISAVVDNVGRIYGYVGNSSIVGQSGTTSRNYALATSKVSLNGVAQSIEDNLQNGDSRGNSTLKYKATYQGVGWDFTNDWTIQDTECYPYNKSQAAPPVISGKLGSGMTEIGGKCISGATVIVNIDGKVYSTTGNGNQWALTVPALQPGSKVYAYSKADGLDFSFRTSTVVTFIGSGTEADPYQIYTAADLANINSHDYYKLMNDIDLSAYIAANSPTVGWLPIGRSSTTMSNLLGDNHKITGLWTNTNDECAGLFASISDANIKDLTIEVAAGKSVKGGNFTGIIAGKITTGSITNCKVVGNIFGSENVGLLTGQLTNGTIANCDANGNVSGSNYSGGVVGYLGSTSVSNSNYVGNVTGNNYCGGVTGYLVNADISTCSVKGNVNGKDFCGGLIGYTENVAVTSCKVEGDVTGTVNVGGITSNLTKSISLVTYMGNIKSSGDNAFAGGIVAKTTAPITLCASKGTLITSGSMARAAGIVSHSNAAITNCYSSMDVEATDYVAGIVAYNYAAVSNCYSSGELTGTNIGAGVVGYNDGASATINNCFAINPVINVTSSTGTAIRVLGGYTNNAPAPTANNYAYNDMAVSVNDVAQKVYDDLLNGISKMDEELRRAHTYTNQGWDFETIWDIDEGTGYPYLKFEKAEPEYIVGDVTGDGNVSVADAAGAVSIILNEDVPNLNRAAADVTGEGEISVADVAGIVNIILGGDASSVKARETNIGHSDPSIALNCYDGTLAMSLSGNVDEYTAIQFDMQLPKGINLKTDAEGYVELNTTSRTRRHLATASQMADGAWRVICYSMNNKSMSGADGEILTFPLEGKVTGHDAGINIQGIELVRTNLSFVHPADIMFNYSDATGIESISESGKSSVIYNLNGQKLSAPSKGVNIINGNKVYNK